MKGRIFSTRDFWYHFNENYEKIMSKMMCHSLTFLRNTLKIREIRCLFLTSLRFRLSIFFPPLGLVQS